MYAEIIRDSYENMLRGTIIYAIVFIILSVVSLTMLRFYLKHKGQSNYYSVKNAGASVFLLLLSLLFFILLLISVRSAYLLSLDSRDGETKDEYGTVTNMRGIWTNKHARALYIGNDWYIDYGNNSFIQWETGIEYSITYLKHSKYIVAAEVIYEERVPNGAKINSEKLALLGKLTIAEPENINSVKNIAAGYIRNYYSESNPTVWGDFIKAGYSLFGYYNTKNDMFFIEAYSADGSLDTTFHIVLSGSDMTPLYIWMDE